MSSECHVFSLYGNTGGAEHICEADALSSYGGITWKSVRKIVAMQINGID